MSEIDDTEPHSQRRYEAFFGRRKAGRLTGRKQFLLGDLLPKLLLCPKEQALDDISSLFEHNVSPLHLEIGFGGGEHLAGQASLYRNHGFIGVEPFINGMAKMLGEIDDRDLTNVRLYDGDAVELLDWLPEKCLARVDLLYPDPWPKRRHWKRRFVSEKNLDRIARVLQPGGLFRFASDIDTYVNWTLFHMRDRQDFKWLAEKSSDWNTPWDGWTRTRYEAKAVREGRPPCHLRFERI